MAEKKTAKKTAEKTTGKKATEAELQITPAETKQVENIATEKTESKNVEVVAETKQVETVAAEKTLTRQFTVTNAKKAGMKILGVHGDVISFDANGNATVDYENATHLAKITGYVVKE